jgi:putative hydrolases of HD superfamily
MLSFMIKDSTVNKDRLMKVCLVHDLAESIVGDITPYDGVSKEDKKKMELDAMKKILDDLEDSNISEELMSLWLEYEEGESAEGDIARQLDKFEMIVQADEYERAQRKRLDSFFKYTEGFFTHPEIKSWADELVDSRNKRLLLLSDGGSEQASNNADPAAGGAGGVGECASGSSNSNSNCEALSTSPDSKRQKN